MDNSREDDRPPRPSDATFPPPHLRDKARGQARRQKRSRRHRHILHQRIAQRGAWR
jgi:hypothetical protein